MDLPEYHDLFPKSKSKWHLSQKVAWSLIIGLLTLSITLGFYIIYDTVKRANEESFEELMVKEKAEFLDEIIHEFPSMREKLIDFAVMKNEYQWVETLLWSNARYFGQDKFFFKNEKKSPPLHVATQNDNPEIVQSLLEFGYDINEKDTRTDYWSYKQNWTAIFDAASKPNSKVLELLIQNGAKVNQRNDQTVTPIHYAANGNSTNNVKILLHYGANPNAEIKPFHETPLLLAVWNRNVEMVKLLLENGADPTLFEYNGKIEQSQSPLAYARNNELEDLIVLLEKYV